MLISRRGSPPAAGFTRIPNAVARAGLPLEAVGLYVYLASAPKGWRVSFRDHRPWPNGYQATRQALSALVRAGLVDGPKKRSLGHSAGFEYVLTVNVSPVDNPVDNLGKTCG